MRPLNIEPTEKTPSVVFDPEKNVFEICGKSVPNDAEAFYLPILEWIEGYSVAPLQKTTITFNLEFFNISSSKRILFILYKLNELIEGGHDVRVKWFYTENDDDMLEVGQDYAFMVKVPFEFKETSRTARAEVLSVA